MENFRMNRTITNITKLGQEVPNFEYWLTQSPERRISAIEFLRKQFHGTESRLQRIYRITQRKEVKYLVVGGRAEEKI